MGTTGDSTGIHLHFGVKENSTYQNNGSYVDPEPYLTGVKTFRAIGSAPAVNTGTSNTAASATQQTSASFNVNDTVILNGAVYRDSYGGGKGNTFANRKEKITGVTPLSRVCPYHLGGIGWVRATDIKKA
jgi:hypothetical protein